jgi:hypothetical protein
LNNGLTIIVEHVHTEYMNIPGIFAAIVVGVVVLSSAFFVKNSNTSHVTVTPTPVAVTGDEELQLQTFTLDEVGEPLDDSTLPTALARNDGRVDDENDQIDDDLSFIKELKDSLGDANESGISQ